jgi:Fe-S-cluster-containing dehydrogenase component
MKVLSFDPELCTGCHICEEVCSETWFKVVDEEKSSIRIYDPDAGLFRAVFCNQCGECIEVCPTEALYRDKHGVVRLRDKLCVGCLSCVGFCPYLAMFFEPQESKPFKCIACGACAKECPTEALSIIEVESVPAS